MRVVSLPQTMRVVKHFIWEEVAASGRDGQPGSVHLSQADGLPSFRISVASVISCSKSCLLCAFVSSW
jgi:hypothetical protein